MSGRAIWRTTFFIWRSPLNGQPVRYFPAGPKADFHVPLSIIESYPAKTRIEVCLAAPRGLSGTVVVDVGILEVSQAG